MIPSKSRKGLIFLLVIASLFGTTITPSMSTIYQNPSNVERPRGILLQNMHNGLLWLIRNMRSANFTPDNVFYGVYNSVGSYNYPLQEIRERNVTLNLIPLRLQLNITIERLQSDLNSDNETLEYLENLYAELKNHTEIVIYHKVDTDLQVTSTHDRKAVSIFYDNDRSVLDAFDRIKNNESLSTQPFTGDEILTNIYLSLIRDSVSGTYEVWNDWTYEDGSDGTLLKDFTRRLTSHRWLMQELKFLFRLRGVNIMRTMIGPEHHLFDTGSTPRVLERGRFSVSQLRIDRLSLHKVGNAIKVNDYDYKYIEHHLLGNLIYNDTNGNGYMDLGIKNVTVGAYNIAYPTIGEEAKFRFDAKAIGQRTYQRPVTTNNMLEFGSNFTDVQGYLQPIEKNQDETLFNVSTGEMHNVDEVSTLFHFGVNNTDSSVTLKFDYVIGNWDNSDELEGLSFNQLLASTVVDAKQKKVIRWKNENGTDLDDDFENSSRISRFRFVESEELFGEIRIDDIPYIWNNTMEVNASGQLIPMNLIDVTYGKISSEADMIRGIVGNAQRKTFLYSVSYPKWDGRSIVHDPSYVAVAGSAAQVTETSDIPSESTGTIPPETSSTSVGVPGFEFTVIFLTIPILALVEVIRRRNK